MGRFEHNEIIAETGTVLKERFVNEKLNQDVKNQIGSIYGMFNGSSAIGYLFTVVESGKEILTGMFCNRLNEIDLNQWDYIADTETGMIFKLYKAPKAIMNDIRRMVMP